MKKTMLSTAALTLLLGVSPVAAQQSGERQSAGQPRGAGEQQSQAQAPREPTYDAATGRMTQPQPPAQRAESPARAQQDQQQRPRQRAQAQQSGERQSAGQARGASQQQPQAQAPREPTYDVATGRMTQPPAQSAESPARAQDQQRTRQRAQGAEQRQPGARAETTGQASQDAPRGAQARRGSGAQEGAQPMARARDSASGSLNDQQRTRISSVINRQNVRPLANVNFSVSVGAVVPRSVRLQPLSAEIVAIAPQFRGHRFFAVQDEIVIVEPSTYRIVAVIPRRTAPVSSTSMAQAPSRVQLTEKQRDSIRAHALRQGSRVTTRSTIAIGERVPSSIELITFPEPIVAEVPTVRPLRFSVQERDVVLVDPMESRVVEVIR
jgi:hypothetical protein